MRRVKVSQSLIPTVGPTVWASASTGTVQQPAAATSPSSTSPLLGVDQFTAPNVPARGPAEPDPVPRLR